MRLPSNFGSAPGEEPHHYFRNICISFKKSIIASKDLALLQEEMERFINASKQMRWHKKNDEVWRKDEGEKAANKVWEEFKRYIKDLEEKPREALSQDLLESISEVERLIKNYQVE